MRLFFDFRAKKLDWEKIKFDDMSADDCQKYWFYIQERIRRYRILSELIPGKQMICKPHILSISVQVAL